MNCQATRNRILIVEEPSELPADLAVHLDGCGECRAWARKFAAVDRVLATLAVPESTGQGKAALLAKLRGAPVEANGVPAVPMSSVETSNMAGAPLAWRLEDDLPKRNWSFNKLAATYWPAGLVAATLLLGALAWMSLRGNRNPPAHSLPADPMLDSLVRLNVELAKTSTPVERLKVLARVADELNSEMREIARADATGDDMRTLEEMYRNVVLEGLVAQAKLVDRNRRAEVLGQVAEGLSRSGEQAEKKAHEAPEHSAVPLREAAGTAREGTKRLRLLIREASL